MQVEIFPLSISQETEASEINENWKILIKFSFTLFTKTRQPTPADTRRPTGAQSRASEQV